MQFLSFLLFSLSASAVEPQTLGPVNRAIFCTVAAEGMVAREVEVSEGDGGIFPPEELYPTLERDATLQGLAVLSKEHRTLKKMAKEVLDNKSKYHLGYVESVEELSEFFAEVSQSAQAYQEQLMESGALKSAAEALVLEQFKNDEFWFKKLKRRRTVSTVLTGLSATGIFTQLPPDVITRGVGVVVSVYAFRELFLRLRMMNHKRHSPIDVAAAASWFGPSSKGEWLKVIRDSAPYQNIEGIHVFQTRTTAGKELPGGREIIILAIPTSL